MPLKVIDGLKTCDGANAAIDLRSQSVTHGTQNSNVVSSSVDMSGFAELIAIGMCNGVTGTPTGTITIQESNESSANFTNITNAVMTFTAANTMQVHSIDWRKPNRKRYARLSAFNATNACILAGLTLRVQPLRGVSLDDNVSQADS